MNKTRNERRERLRERLGIAWVSAVLGLTFLLGAGFMQALEAMKW